MSHSEWVIVIVGAAIIFVILIAASESEKRLDRIARLLERANEQRDERH